ncbi:uncharacterized protein LOC124362064 isoform X3 [Homalodisca vitripennis]|uniref:uncharacterized protein LOC124362064 isoform X3 n=1 Tax=Homalodisca vitripennis TaxID=197043 RepID=UPI001EEB0DE9|nr:uncharacterized protein LOC124362064 isoform X3 [Homalodisca vitripennis]
MKWTAVVVLIAVVFAAIIGAAPNTEIVYERVNVVNPRIRPCPRRGQYRDARGRCRIRLETA